MFSISDYDYKLPKELIAQHPVGQRHRSRLLALHRETGRLSHHAFYELYERLAPSDVLVVNNTEVIPGRLCGRKDTGGKAEVLILDYAGGCRKNGHNGEFICDCLVNASRRPQPGSSIFFDQESRAEVLNSVDGIYTLKFASRNELDGLLGRIGKMPLPPYIRRGTPGESPCDDPTSYQTVYASHKGAIAAPTAGLHFSRELLEKLKSKGIRVIPITLHVGYGTFVPVRVPDIRDHKIHSEGYAISQATAAMINGAKAEGQRIVAVGTTCVRTLEYASDTNGKVRYGSGCCDLFIYPGYRFNVVDAMITNFHLPKSTLLMLVSAFAGRATVLNAYKEAIDNGYRFYSYGDAMFIE